MQHKSGNRIRIALQLKECPMSDENDANKAGKQPGKLNKFEEFLKKGRQSAQQQSDSRGVDPEIQARIDRIMPKPEAEGAASEKSPKKQDIH